MNKALISGITGQCGGFMAKYLLDKGYLVDGLNRRKSIDNLDNIKEIKDKIRLVEGDITDTSSIYALIEKEKYDVVFNLAAQSHVQTSFSQPQTTFEINTLGVLNLLEAIRHKSKNTRLVQLSTSEMFGSTIPPQDEDTLFHPRSPYGVSKLASHYLIQNYHEAYGLKAACAICFNFESKNRGKLFVTRKITEWVKSYKKDPNILPLELGNLDAMRDWSYAGDIADGLYRIAYQDSFYNGSHGGYWRSYCLGSGKSYSIRQFLSMVLTEAFVLDDVEDRFKFIGLGASEKVFDTKTDKYIVKINPQFFRAAEVNHLKCNPSKIKNELGWSPKYSLHDIIVEMLED